MYIPIGKRSNGRGIELSYLDEWVNDSYTVGSIIGFDVSVKVGYPIHLLALDITANHAAVCVLNCQIVLFWSN